MKKGLKDIMQNFKNEKNTNVELLAPVGNMQGLKSAIDGGADAVYLGLSDFNARGNIENFTKENLKEAVEFAHLFGVKVYLTLNILFKDDEVEDVLDLVREANRCKVDAFIVQDVGIANLLKNNFQGIELHASTQMGIHNLEGAKFIESLGFKRVVLSRETPLSEIKRISNNTNLEIEYFVQGALCVGFSGNCYLCSLLAGASGNRGKCKQFCRLKYRINGGEEGYYLSTKDFCLLPSLKDLVDSGVISLKIEGRARRPAYVSTAVQTYRKVLDNNFNFDNDDITNLKKVFNRGDFISGYLNGEKIIYGKAQNHIGVKIGSVISFKKGKRFNEVIIESGHNLQKGDTIKLFDDEKEASVLSPVDIKIVGKNRYLFTTTSVAKTGQIVRLIVDSKFEQEILSKEKKIDFDAFVEAKSDLLLKIRLKSGEVEIEKTFENVLFVSKSQPLQKEDILQTFNKCGNEFNLKNLACNIDDVFIRRGDLNEARRDVLKTLREHLIRANEKSETIIEKDNLLISTQKAGKNSKNIAFFDNIDKILNISKENKENFEYFVYSPSLYKKDDIENVYKIFYDNYQNKKLFLDMPLIATKEDLDCLIEIMESLTDLGVYATNYYCLNLKAPDKTIIGSEMNVINSYAVDFYIKKGYKDIVLSKEEFDFEDIKSDKCQLFIDNRKPRLIYFKHCPIKENFGGNCGQCKYKDNISYYLSNVRLLLERKKVVNCHFYLKKDDTKSIDTIFGIMKEL